MLKLKNICKTYNHKPVLNNITLDFKNQELVFILGPSGSGKSTLLNIIGGNLSCDSGKIYLDNLCITNLKKKELAKYRQSITGTIFQDYNLIESLTTIDNIKLGISKKTNKESLDILLKQLNIYDKQKTKVNKLSGGERQRVAIARALIGNPAIILADEPTGALDSKTSYEVMELLKKISKDKLLIVVSHNKELANKYADRIITIKDGKCKYQKIKDDSKSKISLPSYHHHLKDIFKLPLKKIINKPIRALFSIIAIAIGLLSIMLVTNIYGNFSKELDNLEKRIVTVFPITINTDNHNIDNLTNYLNSIKEIKDITYHYDIHLPLITSNYQMLPMNYLEVMPDNDNYDLIYGNKIENEYEVVLKLNNNNQIDKALLDILDVKDETSIIGSKLKVILNDEYFIKKHNSYIINDDNKALYDESQIALTIVGIVKEKESVISESMLMYDKALITDIINQNKDSNIINDLLNNNYQVLNITSDKTTLLSYLGYETIPSNIDIYVANMTDKAKVLTKLNTYPEVLSYIDNMSSSIKIVRRFITIISLILTIFSCLALITALIMIGIITSITVLECQREIGILKSLGYKEKSIRRLFNTYNLFIGISSFAISLLITILIAKPANRVIASYIGIDNLLNLNYRYLTIIFILNLLFIKLAGTIPVMHASRLDTINCIYGK